MAAKESSAFPSEIDPNFLICGICSERYKNAKILQCLHNFCEPCLDELVKRNGDLKCPTCRRCHDLPEGGVSAIPSNVFANQLVEAFRKHDGSSGGVSKCHVCCKGVSAFFCTECDMHMCENCRSSHRRIPATKSHRTLTLAEYQTAKSSDPVSIQPPAYCTAHPDCKLEFYCDTCEAAICMKCTVLDHPRPEHAYRDLKAASADYKTKLAERIADMKAKEEEADESKAAVEEVTKYLESNFREGENNIKQHAEKTKREICRQIDDSQKSLQEKLAGEFDRRKVSLNAQVKELENTKSDLRHTIEYAENLTQYGNDALLMMAKKGVESQIKELIKIETKVKPNESGFMMFQPEDGCRFDSFLGTLMTAEIEIIEAPTEVQIGGEIRVTINGARAPSCDNIEAVVRRPDGENDKMEIRDNKDGTYVLHCRATMVGEHHISASAHAVAECLTKVNVIPHEDYRLINTFGSKGSGTGQLSKPYGVTFTPGGKVLVCDSGNSRLQMFRSLGQSERVSDSTNIVSSFHPLYTAVAPNGHFHITDYGNKQVIVCDENMKVIGIYGKGNIQLPLGISVSSNKLRYVVDNNGNCVHVYDEDDKFVKKFGSSGTGPGQFSNPYCIDVSKTGTVYVSDCSNNRVQMFDEDGNYLDEFGGPGSGEGQLSWPAGLATDQAGFVYVCDISNSRVVKYTSGGEFVCSIKDGLSGRLFGVSVSEDVPTRVAVTDKTNGCVKIYSQ